MFDKYSKWVTDFNFQNLIEARFGRIYIVNFGSGLE